MQFDFGTWSLIIAACGALVTAGMYGLYHLHVKPELEREKAERR